MMMIMMVMMIIIMMAKNAGLNFFPDAPKTDASTAANGGDAPACKDFTQVTEELWANDLDRLAPDEVKVNFQAQLPDKGNIQDKSPKKFVPPGFFFS